MPEETVLSNQQVDEAVKTLNPEEHPVDKFPVLIIDDDSWIHRIIGHYLQSWGFSPISAFDAIEGIALAIKHRPLVIFLDIIMPEVKGDTLLKMLKKIDLTVDIPVLILSGNLNVDILSSTYKKGAAGYIAKPFTQELLFEKLKECLGPAIFNNANIKNLIPDSPAEKKNEHK